MAWIDFLGFMFCSGAPREMYLPGQQVYTSRAKDIEEKLDDWCDTVDELMRNIQKTTHLINTEYMVHQHLLAKH